MLKRDVVNALGDCQANRSEEVTSLVGILQIKFEWGTFLDALASLGAILESESLSQSHMSLSFC